jgi:hypothetical protein
MPWSLVHDVLEGFDEGGEGFHEVTPLLFQPNLPMSIFIIKRFIPFENPIHPAEYKITPPQSYCYISNDLFDMLLRKNNLPKYSKKGRVT